MEIAAFASFLVLVVAWLVLPLRVPATVSADREPAPLEVQPASAAA